MRDVELDVADSFERVFPVPTVVADWDEVLDRAGARNGAHTRPPSRWRVVAIALGIVAGAALLATPALGLGDRLLSLIQGKRDPLDVQAPAWSPDGRTIVFVSWRDGNGEVYAMNADSSSPRNLTQHPAKDVRPAWSPDGRRIAFVSSRDGRSQIYVMNADGSGKRNVSRNRANDDYPTWSPNGRRIAFLRATRSNGIRFWGHELYVVNADGSGLRRLTRNPKGYFLYQTVWSPDGRTIYAGPYVADADGSGAQVSLQVGAIAVWSPDGTRIAFARKPDWCSDRGGTRPCAGSHSDIYVMNADGSGTRKLTHNARQNAEPAWSPDGRRIAFVSRRDGNAEIYVMNADGSGKRNLTRNPAKDVRPSWSPDGQKIAFVSDRDGRLEAHVMNADGSGQRSLAVQER
jgi:Tol biopolymer transport system component